MYVIIFLVEWPPIGKIADHSAYDMFSWYKYLIVNLIFSYLGFWSGNLFLIAPFFLIVAYLYLSKRLRLWSESVWRTGFDTILSQVQL